MVTSPFSIKLPFQLRSPMGHQTWGPRDTKDAIRSFDACGPTQADLGGFFKRGGPPKDSYGLGGNNFNNYSFYGL
jgi:hypothetical protein